MANFHGDSGHSRTLKFFWPENFKLILATRSPRRIQLIKQMDIPFEIVTIPFDESSIETKDVVHIARMKNMAYSHDLKKGEILLTADTLVILDDEIMGKPANETEAKIMLKKLSGRKHLVETGVCLRTSEEIRCFKERTKIFFKNLQDREIEYYVRTYKPFDKAGGYGIQEWIGLTGIEKISGDYYNVMGLPTSALWQELKEILRRTSNI